MATVNTYWNALLAAFGDTTGALNVNDFYTKLPVAVAAGAGGVSQGPAVTSLTNSTGATANDVVENVPAATAATTDTSAASLTSTNAAITALENDISDLTGKVNALLTSLRTAGVIAP